VAQNSSGRLFASEAKVMEMKEQIVGWVVEIDNLRAELADHWSKVQKSVAADRVDDAISLLNGYFHLKEQLEGVEARLASTLHSSFSDK
jgi:hypothetical protein